MMRHLPQQDSREIITHVALLRSSLKRCSGIDLAPPETDDAVAADLLFNLPTPLFSHSSEGVPRFTYANRMGMRLFEIPWKRLIETPSSVTVLEENAAERKRLLDCVRKQGYIDNYTGKRVTANGRRIIIKDTLVWNLLDAFGTYQGQAAFLRHWRYI